ncbi:MAG TPA: twin-arginine translocation signal domain-containing protein [Candidatus Dormibacteraeota bacterium]|nr:twin-arginine translocation signal domain-containing protein [Candidatus Dormibacteraeota bacterium]
MLSRRDLMGKLAASGAVLVAAGAARASMAPSNLDTVAESGPGKAAPAHQGTAEPPAVDAGIPETASAEAPWELLRPLAMGSVVAHGWRVAGFTGAVDGTCVLTLENERGRAHRIHLCRNAGNPQGIVYTDSVDLLVMNGGQGDLATDETFAQAVAEVAHVLSANERRQATVVASLMPHDERLRRFTGADRRLR